MSHPRFAHYSYSAREAGFCLERTTSERRTLEDGEVRVRVHASSLNYRDLLTLRGSAGQHQAGKIPLSDGAGEIIEVGSGVPQWKPGDRVAGCFFPRWLSGRFDLAHHRHDLGGNLHGMLTEEAVLSAEGVVRLPDHLSYEEAACLPCAGVTAWHALVMRGGFQPGSTVLVQGTGGVALFAVQLVTAMEGRVILISSDDRKRQRAEQLGVAHTINYRENSDWEREVWRLTGKRGVDHVVEVGGAATLDKAIQCTSAGGHIAMIGVLSGNEVPALSIIPLLTRNIRLDGIYVGPRVAFTELNAFFAQKQLRPVIDRVFPFHAASEALDYFARGEHFGKVVLRHV